MGSLNIILYKYNYYFVEYIRIYLTSRRLCNFVKLEINELCLDVFNTAILCFRHTDLNQLASSVQEMKNKLSYLKKTASDVNKIKTVGM